MIKTLALVFGITFATSAYADQWKDTHECYATHEITGTENVSSFLLEEENSAKLIEVLKQIAGEPPFDLTGVRVLVHKAPEGVPTYFFVDPDGCTYQRGIAMPITQIQQWVDTMVGDRWVVGKGI